MTPYIRRRHGGVSSSFSLSPSLSLPIHHSLESTMVRTLQLSDGKQIPAIGWGNGTGGLEDSGEKAINTGKIVLESGILHIDTAQWYKTETETGAAIKAAGIPREKVWITTKSEFGDLESVSKGVLLTA